MKYELFSTRLKAWLESDKPKTIDSLAKVFAQKSFVVIILVLMLFPSLPLPTGGVSHLFEIIAMILALEMIIGFKTILLPKKFRQRNLGAIAQKKIIPFFYNKIVWFEKHSTPLGGYYLSNSIIIRVIGLILLAFIITAFIAPPFSGLDTLPSLSVVIICLGLILEDMKIFIAGVVLGTASLAALIFFGSIIVDFMRHLFNSLFGK
jgi:hypothetical protein